MSALLTMTLLLATAFAALILRSEAACGACPFQWEYHGGYCYLYFAEPLPYGEAVSYCEHYRRLNYVAHLVNMTDPEEVAFIGGYINKIHSVRGSVFHTPSFVWEQEATDRPQDPIMAQLLFLQTLSPVEGSLPCEEKPLASDWYEIRDDAGVIQDQNVPPAHRVPAPAVVPSECAVRSGPGYYFDLGDFPGSCVSDPDVCTNGSSTWSIWLNIDPFPVYDYTSLYYVSSGGQTQKAKGLVFRYNDSNFLLAVRTESYAVELVYDPVDIPKGKWFHMVAAFDINSRALNLYVDGLVVTPIGETAIPNSTTDSCTTLRLGMTNSCTASYPVSQYGGPASYSNLAVMDGLLTDQQIANLHSCGSFDWAPSVRSFREEANADPTAGPTRAFVCRASALSGPWIKWTRYHSNGGLWDNLKCGTPDSRPYGYTIQTVRASSCVVRSVLTVTSATLVPGDIVACSVSTANKSYAPDTKMINISEGFLVWMDTFPFYAGLPLEDSAACWLTNPDADHCTEDRLNGHPFVCKIGSRFGEYFRDEV